MDAESYVLRALSERYPWCAATVAASMGPSLGAISALQPVDAAGHLQSLQARGLAAAFNDTKPTRWLRTAAGTVAVEDKE